ncbi:FMN-binding glutamate synthase family protein [soil metagenome]
MHVLWLLLVIGLVLLLLGVVAVQDLVQRKHAIRRNFPVIGRFRYYLEKIGPELRQYIVAGDDEERPFSRDQRRWVYASAKQENNYFAFGTDDPIDSTPGHVLVKHSTLGCSTPASSPQTGIDAALPCAKVLGASRGRRHAFRPASVVNISGMSFGALSGAAVEALNRGAALAGCLHNTCEGGLSPHHRHGGELVFQLGTAYFGVRDESGRFDLARLRDLVASAPVRALEIKLSQGAKPGLGGHLPGAKVSAEIAATRGIPVGGDCISPSRHAEFSTVDGLLDFVELLADETGLPVTLKSAVGELHFWQELADAMASGTRGVDGITIDGGEGGTGAAPLVFTDHVALPFRTAFPRVYGVFAERGLPERVVWGASAKVGLPDRALLAMAMGADLLHAAREPMLAIGCIQAKKCHTDHCPTGVATQSAWLSRGLDPTLKSVRCANYVKTLRRDMLKVSQAAGHEHPALLTTDDLEMLSGAGEWQSGQALTGYPADCALPSQADRAALVELMSPAPEGGSVLPSATSQG